MDIVNEEPFINSAMIYSVFYSVFGWLLWISIIIAVVLLISAILKYFNYKDDSSNITEAIGTFKYAMVFVVIAFIVMIVRYYIKA